MIIKANLMGTGKYMNIRGKKLYVETYGNLKNKPVLYLHGGPGESCYDFSFHQAERLKDSLYVIMIDQRGVCRSEEITEDEAFGLNDLIEDCEELKKVLQIERWSVIGHSFGGYVALLYASIYPSSIEKIIFEGPTFDFALTSRALLQNPMLLIVGKHDVVTCKKQIATFNKDARNGKYIVFEESGHSPHYEEADRFAETVMHFLK
ncbi:alpha/beta fold hydrolase [Bacillus cereus]|uniref:alpha/beta fold hydrolase n=1 Tax=Bacillus cereus TaxID=1396 RepID=UPI003625DEC3|nr:alpha/beta fold hydrolase [Bacillus cereus]